MRFKENILGQIGLLNFDFQYVKEFVKYVLNQEIFQYDFFFKKKEVNVFITRNKHINNKPEASKSF